MFTLLAFAAAKDGAVTAIELPEDKNIIISEIKLGGQITGQPTEFVEIYNSGSQTVNIDGWIIERAKPSAVVNDCLAYPWADESSDTSAIKSYELTGSGDTLQLEPGSAVVAEVQFNDGKSGTVRLLEPASEEGHEPLTRDLVGWGDTAACYQVAAGQIPANGESLQRLWDCQLGQLVNSGVNSNDFAINQQPNPAGLDENEIEACSNDTPPDQDEYEDKTSCEGAIITELLANAEGPDTGNEFIELHNPTADPINLTDCRFSLDDNEKKSIGNIILSPGQYMAFSDTETGITLPNSAGGVVYLIDFDDVELQSVNYPAGMEGDVAWAWFAGEGWQQTYSPTSGAANIKQPDKPCPQGQYRSKETGHCRSLGVGGSELKPCNPDQFRNPLTNRCKLKNDDSGLKSCRSDQFRNPETNRCKLTSSGGSELKPCNPDQFRNPVTNRCKKINSGSGLKPCDEDQERNPETNRCRKVRGASTGELAKVEDVEAPVVTGSYGWMLAGVTGLGVLGYAGWEWRREILALISKLKP